MRVFVIAVLFLLTLAIPFSSQAQTRPGVGYEGRASGMDMDDDFVYGGAGDVLVCDSTGGSDVSNFYEEDVDGDAVAEQQIFVDCDGGTDNSTCGLPGTPCLTLNYALNTRADGTGSSKEDIVCFKGTCSPDNLRDSTDGVSGTKTKVATGNEAFNYLYAKDPKIIMGWDVDGDDSYPPFDTDDTSIMDGAGLDRAFELDSLNYTEYAHFDVINYGQAGNSSSGFMQTGNSDYLYWHDIEMDGVLEGTCATGNRPFNWGGIDMNYLAVENMTCIDCGGYYGRGGANLTSSFFRFKNITHRCVAADEATCGGGNEWQATCYGFDHWGGLTGFEILDSYFDGNLDAFDERGSQMTWIQFGTCASGYRVINNELDDWRSLGARQFGSSGFCTNSESEQVSDDTIIDRNLVYIDQDRDTDSADFLWITKSSTRGVTRLGDVTITNNIFYTIGECSQYFVNVDAGNNDTPQTGTITIVNNTYAPACWSSSHKTFLQVQDPGTTYKQQDFVIKNNIIVGPSGGDQFEIEMAPTGWESDYNVFDSDMGYIWDSSQRSTLGNWQSVTGGDANSAECTPTFISSTDLHLAANDLCALDNGATLLTVTDSDYDGLDNRPVNNWDIGADEVEEGEDPPAPDPGDGIVLSGSGLDGSNTQ